MNIEQARFNMIEQQIRPWDVLDLNVLDLLARVRREDFVPPAYQALAFVDAEVPLGHGQVMLAPKVEARLLQEAQVQRHERVLEVGAGSGFMTALLAHRAQSVIALERIGALAAMATANLRRGGVLNASVRDMDGQAGLPGDGPFDVIMLSGSVAEVPQALLDQLKIGGRLLTIVGQEPVMRAVRITRLSATALQSQDLFDTVAPRLAGFGEPTRFHF
ncbi:protein-L-isoaspartate O-methyltransferase family protein [Pseudaquabacterium pictum]|uniref:Protein-L-isoaspartate O-methyltransferase n=1 Tax=Pseudaquabacterium pictum TaxID=2315236 RepID=A0A480ALY4_9BURK|nr:protein-L-isoaspartate O-methyltransferase [Rubrivivax pictus]GCL61417.1 protein-L-isoaspartate O-methyltransferase [Rubrivivax pictus]